MLIEPDISLLTLETLLFVRSTELLCSLATGLPSAPELELKVPVETLTNRFVVLVTDDGTVAAKVH